MDRVLPHDLDAETAVLGSMLLDLAAAARAAALLRPSDFYRGPHGEVFRACCSLLLETHAIDIVLLRDRLAKDGTLARVGGFGFLSGVMAAVPSAANVEHYAQIVLRLSGLRRLILSASSTLDAAFAGDSDPKDLVSHFLAGSRDDSRRGGAFAECGDDVEGFLLNSSNDEPALPTGIDVFDEKFGGLPRQGLIVIAGRPSMGKSSLGLQVLRAVTKPLGRPSAFFSLEMTRRAVSAIQLGQEAEVNTITLRRNRDAITPAEWDRLAAAVGRIRSSGIYIDDDAGNTVEMIRTKALLLEQERGPLGAIMVDYLQYVPFSAAVEKAQTEQKIAHISQGLTRLAKEMKVPVIAISQLKRTEKGERPTLTDLRHSGQIEQDAECVIAVHRPEMYEVDEAKKQEVRGDAELLVLKYRDGETGMVTVDFKAPFQKFVSRPRVAYDPNQGSFEDYPGGIS